MILWLLLISCLRLPGQESATAQYAKRVAAVRSTKGFAALWDFVKREQNGERFDAWKPPRERADLRLDVLNYVRQYWAEGRAAAYADIPLLREGPFGQAIALRAESDATFRPLLLVPRERFHGSGIDVRGKGRSVTLVVWLKRAGDSGTHAVAGIWHEGTDLKNHGSEAKRVERGRRQYALFGGLAANPGAAAGHISENGASSFGDKYARHIGVTRTKIPVGEWAAIAMVFDNRRDRVTCYVNGAAEEHWIGNPSQHPFFQWAARAWERGEYRPPKEFVKVANGRLQALRVNPYWFPHDLYSPQAAEDGGPFTIGRVIHMGRNASAPGAIGGVAVFSRALGQKQLRKLTFNSALQ
ncbi:MAG: hypothetical protein JNK48_22575 [Bryobacterales bacterium]|nr:hypothetical protein [Bryobacterales bacterium]